MLVGRRMTHNPKTISADASIAEAIERMKREKVRRYPVLDEKGALVGIVSRDDLHYATPSAATSLNVWELTYLLSQVKVKEVMTKKVITVTESTPLEQAARLMVENKIGGLPVMRGDKIVGIITESDMFRIFTELFEGDRESGVRMTVLAPYFKGSLAQISSAVTQRGGLIVALNIFRGEDPTNWVAYMKVCDITKDELVEVVKPLVLEILDVTEV